MRVPVLMNAPYVIYKGFSVKITCNQTFKYSKQVLVIWPKYLISLSKGLLKYQKMFHICLTVPVPMPVCVCVCVWRERGQYLFRLLMGIQLFDTG